MPSLILGLVGQAGCGKGTVAKYFKTQYGATTFSFSTSMRDVLRRLHLEESRDHLVKVSEMLRQGFGEDLFSRVIAADAREATTDLVVIEGIRRPMDIATLSHLPNFVLVAIDVDIETRFARMKARGQNAGEKDMTWEQFLSEEQRSTEISIPGVMKEAKYTLKNNGSVDDLAKEAEQLLQTLNYAHPHHPHTS
jgi:dephospho-CoA kinase